jgi:hypothetical protein
MIDLEQQHRCKGKPSVPPPEAPRWICSCACREREACMREGSSAPPARGRCSTRAEDVMKERVGPPQTARNAGTKGSISRKWKCILALDFAPRRRRPNSARPTRGVNNLGRNECMSNSERLLRSSGCWRSSFFVGIKPRDRCSRACTERGGCMRRKMRGDALGHVGSDASRSPLFGPFSRRNHRPKAQRLSAHQILSLFSAHSYRSGNGFPKPLSQAGCFLYQWCVRDQHSTHSASSRHRLFSPVLSWPLGVAGARTALPQRQPPSAPSTGHSSDARGSESASGSGGGRNQASGDGHNQENRGARRHSQASDDAHRSRVSDDRHRRNRRRRRSRRGLRRSRRLRNPPWVLSL